MLTTRIENRIGVRASSERIWDLIVDLPGWSRWNAHETEVTGTIAFGGSLSFAEAFPGQPPRNVTARIGDWQPYAQLVWAEKRGWAFDVVRYFEIEELVPGSCIFANGMIFSGLRGELFHDRHRKTQREAFGAIGEGLRTLAET